MAMHMYLAGNDDSGSTFKGSCDRPGLGGFVRLLYRPWLQLAEFLGKIGNDALHT
jgi:hypothetical protein